MTKKRAFFYAVNASVRGPPPVVEFEPAVPELISADAGNSPPAVASTNRHHPHQGTAAAGAGAEAAAAAGAEAAAAAAAVVVAAVGTETMGATGPEMAPLCQRCDS